MYYIIIIIEYSVVLCNLVNLNSQHRNRMTGNNLALDWITDFLAVASLLLISTI